MQKLIETIVMIMLFGIGLISITGCDDKPKKLEKKTEQQMIIQETESTNKKLSNR